jgi:HEAT repeat protein
VAAAIALGQRRDRGAVPELLERLRHDTTFVQPSVLIALGRIGDPAALPLLLDRAVAGPSWTRVCALRALADLGDPSAVLAARDALNDVAWSVRGAGADVLGRIGDASDLPRLLRLLEDVHPWPRRGALYALGRLDLVEAVPRMREELRSPSAEVRLAAIWSLGRLRDDGARELLVGILKALPVGRRPGARKAVAATGANELGTDAEDRTFDALIQSLGRIAEPTQDPAVLRVLLEARARVREDEWDRPARLPPPEIRVEASIPTLRMLFDAAIPIAADEEGEV